MSELDAKMTAESISKSQDERKNSKRKLKKEIAKVSSPTRLMFTAPF